MSRVRACAVIMLVAWVGLAARGESPAAFDGRCIRAGGVAPASHIGHILGRRALPARRLDRLRATRDLHHGLLGPGLAKAGRDDAQGVGGVIVFTGARVIDGTGAAPIENAVLVVNDGRIVAVGRDVPVPAGARRVDARGKTIVPGFVNAHGHVNAVRGMRSSPEFYTPEHIRHQLGVYGRYGITSVFSLGGDGPAGVQVRDAQRTAINTARLFVAGPVIGGTDPAAVRRAVDEAAALKVDLIKIRVDDNLGASPKMPRAAYAAVIDQAHSHGLKVAAHIFYLQDAKDVVSAGVDFIAHSVRDLPVDRPFIDQLKDRGICVSPTLMREVSAYVYETRPAFFDDPLFLREADPATVAALQAPAYQAAMRTASAARYKDALVMAKANVKRLSDAGVRLAFGSDTGPAGRFQGYFEQIELAQMVDAGLTPMQAIVAATGDAARCMNVGQRIGTLTPGLEADFLILTANPLDDIRNTRAIESVWIHGRELARDNP